MIDLLQHSILVFAAFFAIMNPISNTAVFVGLTANEDRATQKKTAYRALIITFFIILAFALFGKVIFHLFGITLPALKITGGILVFLIGFHMLNGQNSKMHSTEDESDVDVAVSPLAVPLLGGPGTIATAMNYSADGGWMAIIITVSMFALLSVITYVSFIFGQKMVKSIGKSGLDIVTRLMGLILAVIGTQMLVEGIFGAIGSFSN